MADDIANGRGAWASTPGRTSIARFTKRWNRATPNRHGPRCAGIWCACRRVCWRWPSWSWSSRPSARLPKSGGGSPGF